MGAWKHRSELPRSALLATHFFGTSDGFSLVVTKEEDTPDDCVYTFGTPTETMGRVRLHKSSGDIEILDLFDTGEGPSAQFCLAQLVPQLHDFHANDTYPPSKRWQV